MDIEMYSTITEASQNLSVSRQMLRKLVKIGRLIGKKKGSAWLIANSSLEAYQKARERKPEIYQ